MTFLVEIGTDMGKCINTQTDVFFGKRYIKSRRFLCNRNRGLNRFPKRKTN
jgi:hypothetical protein